MHLLIAEFRCNKQQSCFQNAHCICDRNCIEVLHFNLRNLGKAGRPVMNLSRMRRRSAYDIFISFQRHLEQIALFRLDQEEEHRLKQGIGT